MTFDQFKKGVPAQELFAAMGLSDYLEKATNWGELRSLIVDFNGCDEGNFVERARRYDGVCSSGERVLLRAVMYVTDFAWLADELDEGRTWFRMSRASGEYREAVAACVGAYV